MTVTSRISLRIEGLRTIASAGGIPELDLPYQAALAAVLADGDSLDEADEVWFGVFGIAAGESTTFDLQSLQQRDPTGATIRTVSFDEIKAGAIVETSDSDTGGTLTIGNATSDAWAGTSCLLDDATYTKSIESGDGRFWTSRNGATVDATHKNLKLAAADQVCSGYVMLIGVAS